MKITIVNGSARKGNSAAMIEAFCGGAKQHEVEVIAADRVNMAFCKGCNVCECHKGCVDQDDTNPVVDKLVASDMILFVTPVYWWGMSAQLKLVIDKCYSKGYQLKGKKIGVLVVGGSPLDEEQYVLIERQFRCMAEYLQWEICFYRSYFANDRDELRNDPAVMAEVAELGQAL